MTVLRLAIGLIIINVARMAESQIRALMELVGRMKLACVLLTGTY